MRNDFFGDVLFFGSLLLLVFMSYGFFDYVRRKV